VDLAHRPYEEAAAGMNSNIFGDTWAYLTDPANWQGPTGIWHLLLQQLLISFTALAVAVAIGLPIAMWLGHLGRGGFLAINISNIGRAVPTFALLALLVTADFPGTTNFGPYGRAGLATLIALTLFALPPIITNGYVAVREVPAEIREAADGMGMTGWQKFARVEFPLAATIAALVAGPGLGRIITDGFYRTNYAKGIAGAVVVAVVALLLELFAGGVLRTVERSRTPSMRNRDPEGEPVGEPVAG
jgi:osmoprotectant transport system permease protein